MMDKETAKMFLEKWRRELIWWRREYLADTKFFNAHPEENGTEHGDFLLHGIAVCKEAIDDCKKQIGMFESIIHA